MTTKSVSISIPEYLANQEESICICATDDGYGFAGQVTRRAYQADCSSCGGQSTALWLPPAFCPFCGAELEAEPKLQWMDLGNPFDLEAYLEEHKPDYKELRESLRDAIRSFLQSAVDAE